MVTGGVKVQLDEMRTLRYDTPVLIRLDQEHGLPLQTLIRRMEALSLYAITAAVWAGLLHAEPNITMEKVAAERVPLHRLQKISEGVCGALMRDTGLQDEEEETDEGNAAPPP